MNIHLAIDLGAESGRVMAVGLESGRVLLEELHRFRHAPVTLPTGLHWDITGLWRETTSGLTAAAGWARSGGHTIQSVGVDSWGVDFGLLDSAGELVALPRAYRDPRNEDWARRVQAELGVDRIYRETGIQMLPFNTLYPLKALQEINPRLVAAADQLVFIPDLFHYWLSGEIAVEQTIASTSQMLDVHRGGWAGSLIKDAGLVGHLFGPLVPAGTVLGELRAELADSCGLPRSVRVIAPASHDTASAVVAVPASPDTRWCYLSSGTWSLLGAELSGPCVSAASQHHMFTNEAGYGGTTRFLKNIAGLWLVQQCRAAWSKSGRDWSYDELTSLAAREPAGRTLIDPASSKFYAPPDMLQAISDFARRSGQPIPETPGQFVRCCLESLALAYRRVLEQMEACLSQSFDMIHIVGGGSQNQLLNQLAADLTGRIVIPGPAEATALGNGLVQALACGELGSLGELREVVRSGTPTSVCRPADASHASALVQRFAELPLV